MEPFAGFGSPVGSPANMSMGTPENVQRRSTTAAQLDTDSPLLFRRTPVPGANGTDNSRKFGDWFTSTSPYAGQKTPPTVSMKSIAAGDENTPPADHTGPSPDGTISSQRFQAWLKATGSTNWTPKQNASAATPPRAPAPTPMGTPMSISRDPASTASPATEEPRSRPIFDLGGSDVDSDAEETDTIVGDNEVAAAAARMRAALLTAQAGIATLAPMPRAPGSNMPATGLRAPAPSPVVSSPVPAAYSCRLQPDIDSLATPMSQLSMSRGDHRSTSKPPQQQTPSGGWRSRLTPSRSQPTPSSPVDKVIGLMIEPEQQGSHHRHHHHTPSRFAATAAGAGRNSHPAPSPQQQVIHLMLQQQDGDSSDQEDMGAAAADTHQAAPEQAIEAAQHGAGHAAFGSPAEDDEYEERYYSDSEAGYSSSGTESEDEIDVTELQQLVGAAGGPGTPINDIISMMLTPELRATPDFTPRDEVAAGQQPGDGVGPRVLFADD